MITVLRSWALSLSVTVACTGIGKGESVGKTRSTRFEAETTDDAVKWQKEARSKLFKLLMGGAMPNAPIDRLQPRQLNVGAHGLDQADVKRTPWNESPVAHRAVALPCIRSSVARVAC